MLYRHLNVGNPSRSLALAETGRKEFLPVDDTAWEQGVSLLSYVPHDIRASDIYRTKWLVNHYSSRPRQTYQQHHTPDFVKLHIYLASFSLTLMITFRMPARDLKRQSNFLEHFWHCVLSCKQKPAMKLHVYVFRWQHATGIIQQSFQATSKLIVMQRLDCALRKRNQ